MRPYSQLASGPISLLSSPPSWLQPPRPHPCPSNSDTPLGSCSHRSFRLPPTSFLRDARNTSPTHTHTRPSGFIFLLAPSPSCTRRRVNAHYLSSCVYKVAANTELANPEPLLLRESRVMFWSTHQRIPVLRVFWLKDASFNIYC